MPYISIFLVFLEEAEAQKYKNNKANKHYIGFLIFLCFSPPFQGGAERANASVEGVLNDDINCDYYIYIIFTFISCLSEPPQPLLGKEGKF